MRLLAVLLLSTALAAAQTGFTFEEPGPVSIRLLENGRPVYVYNYGKVLPEGVPEDRARCCYLHPVWAPNGVVVTDDFPKDHLHHRGIFWAWPVVRYRGVRYDLWLMRGVERRFSRWLAREASPRRARLAVENAWFLGDDQIVRETVEIVAYPVRHGSRRLDFRLLFEALRGPVTLSGAPKPGTAYGGFCVRFAPRRETRIITETGVLREENSNLVPSRWAQLEALYEGGRAALRIDIDPANPGYPNGWCLRHYGFLGVDFPGYGSYPLNPGEPLELRYRVTVAAGR